MNEMIASGIAVTVAYLAGSIPFGLVTAKLAAGIDIRQHGSGNIGATNVGRVVGAKWGVLVLVLDACKGLAPVLLLPRLAVAEECVHLQVLCGVATIVGHMFPCWLGFQGGKGVATALGVVGVLAGWGTLTALVIFIVSICVFRIVALSSLLAAFGFAVCQMIVLQPDPFSPEKWSLTAFSLFIPLLIVLRHRANIGRLMRGEEPRFVTAKQRRKNNNDSQGTPDAPTDE